MRQETKYISEQYWNQVAGRMKCRKTGSLLAGDTEPYYQYKREKFVALLNSLDFQNKKVLELGCGPGGNLIEILKHKPRELTGVDISGIMLELARQNVQDSRVKFNKIDGKSLPYPDNSFDTAFTSTVLQHITDTETLEKIIAELARTTRSDIYIFERITRKKRVEASNVGRPVAEYKRLFSEEHFFLHEVKFLNTYWSYLFCGITRKLFSKTGHKEGEPRRRVSDKIQSGILLVTKHLDKLLPLKGDHTMLHFIKAK
jgi:SAM-dependent methyltransferase